MKKIKLGDVLDVKRGQSISGDYFSETGKYIRLTLGNFNYPGGGFKENTSKTDIYYLGPIKPEALMQEGDIITPLTEQVSGLLGETATIPCSNLYIQNGDVGKVIPNEKVLNKRYSYYLVSSPIVKKQLDASAQQTKIRHTSPDAIKGCIAWITESLEEQRAIAQLLDDINTKISLNNSICSDLEAMAKQLYDYWFVQFDFPDENGKPYKSSGGKMVWGKKLKREIPEGWRIGVLGDIVDRKQNSCSPQHTNGLPYTPMDMLPSNKMSFSEFKSDDEANSSLLNYEKYDILFGAMRAYFHRVCIAPFKGITRTTTFVLTPKNRCELGYAYELINEERSVNFAVINSVGTQQPYAEWDGNFAEMPVVVPPSTLIQKYSEIILPYIDEVISLNVENQQLISIRDFLLPMLMNGQVKIK